MSKRSEERSEFLWSILVTGIEGGIDYWATVEGAHYCDENGGPIDGFWANIQEHDEEAEPVGPVFKLSAKVIATGVNRIIDGRTKVSERLRSHVAAASAIDEGGDIGAGDADCIIQSAVFGEVRYG
jgi:hypothetical protein